MTLCGELCATWCEVQRGKHTLAQSSAGWQAGMLCMVLVPLLDSSSCGIIP
jgi:hypothetical protein